MTRYKYERIIVVCFPLPETARDPMLIGTPLDHCLQLFFDAARCKGDTALTTFQWFASDPRPAAIFDGQHECIDWGKLLEWAEERHVSKDEMASLINPMYNGSSDA